MENMSFVDANEAGLELAMQELEPMDAPSWTTVLVAVGSAVASAIVSAVATT
jgi:hypothetical protein